MAWHGSFLLASASLPFALCNHVRLVLHAMHSRLLLATLTSCQPLGYVLWHSSQQFWDLRGEANIWKVSRVYFPRCTLTFLLRWRVKCAWEANRNVQHDKRFEDFVSETRNLKKFPSQKANRLETSKRRRRSGSRRKHARDVPLHVKQQASNMQTHFGFGFPSVCSRFCK